MKNILYTLAAVATLILASCQKDLGDMNGGASSSEVIFSAGEISGSTRVSGDIYWDKDDAIGITMYDNASGAVLSDNIEYRAVEDGEKVGFEAYDSDEAIYYINDITPVDFWAYHPYNSEWTDAATEKIFDVSVQDGTAENLSLSDLMVSDYISNKTSGEQSFIFRHQLSKVVITVKNFTSDKYDSDYTDLEAVVASATGFDTQYNFVTGEKVSSTAKEIGMYKESFEDGTVSFTAIMVVGENVGAINFTDGTHSYSTQLNVTTESGKQYNYSTTIGIPDVEIVLESEGITDWADGGSDTPPTDLEIKYEDGVPSYYIYSEWGFRFFADKVSGGSYSVNGKLMADIVLTEAFTPIAEKESEKMYTGEFDGDGHSITGLSMTATGAYTALFAAVSGATIKNLKVGGKVTSESTYSAMLVGYATKSIIENCETLADSEVDSSVGYSGGIVAVSYCNTIKNCINRATVKGSNYIGGIVGASMANIGASTIDNCYNEGEISATSMYVGGVAGSISTSASHGSDIVRHSGNSGKVTSSYALFSDCEVGGLVGTNNGGKIYNSYNSGNVEARAPVGGLVGSNENSGTVENCYTTGTVTCTRTGYVAGLVLGQASSGTNMQYCYYLGTLSGQSIGEDGTNQMLNAAAVTAAQLQSANFVTVLNNRAYELNQADSSIALQSWKATSGSYPTSYDEEQAPTFTDITSVTYLGSGGSTSPYLIYNGDQLRQLSTDVFANNTYSGKYIKLMNDIDLGGEANEFKSIGGMPSTIAYSFSGNFDGGGHLISGLYINKSDSDYQGLFGSISGATIKNVGVSGKITGRSRVGGIVGYVTNYNFTISKCYTLVDIYATSLAGGIVGNIYYTDNHNISNCYSRSNIQFSDSNGEGRVGGIVGNFYYRISDSSSIENCYSAGSIIHSLGTSNLNYVGGILGDAGSISITIDNCYFNSTLFNSSNVCGSFSSSSITITNSSGKTTGDMTGGSFAATLGSDNWMEDSDSSNGGYPILIYK